MELQEPDPCDVKGAGQEKKIEAQSTKAQVRDGPTRSSVEVLVMSAEQRGWGDLLKSVCQPYEGGTCEGYKTI